MQDINHSTANESFVIFSSEHLATDAFLAKRKIAHKTPYGVWEGKAERAWIVNAKQFYLIRQHPQILRGQECVLHLGPINEREEARPAELEYIKRKGLWYGGGKREAIGYFRQVSKAEAEAAPGYTRDGDTFYLAK